MKSPLYVVAFVLMAIGGLNWGLVGLFDYNLVAELFGDGSSLSRVVYSLVGLSTAVAAAIFFGKSEK